MTNSTGIASLVVLPSAALTLTVTPPASSGLGPSVVKVIPTSGATVGVSLGVSPLPRITSPNTATFDLHSPGSFAITTGGSPSPKVTVSPKLPKGLKLVSGQGGAYSISGSPSSPGIYSLSLTAKNSVGVATQQFTLAVLAAPTFTSKSSIKAVLGSSISFTVTTASEPVASLSVTGILPGNLHFTDLGNGNGLLSGGSSLPAGSYNVVISAANSLGLATQSITLKVK